MASYTEVSISDYNLSAPTDDGSSATTNVIHWSTIKTKLGDPLNTAIAALNTAVIAAAGTIDTAVTTANTNITTLNSALTTAQTKLYAPAGTEMIFLQTAAPTNWTKITTHNDKMLRLVTGTVSTGGTTAFTTVFASRSLTTTEMPSHSHTFSDPGSAVTLGRSSWTTSFGTSTEDNLKKTASERTVYQDVNRTSAAISASVAFSGTTGSNGSGDAIDFAVQYVDVILASKD